MTGNNIVKIELNALENEKQALIAVFKRQLEAFRRIRKELEKVTWADARYDALIDSLNAIGHVLSSTFQTLTNGRDTYVISDLIPWATEYLNFERKFPG